MSYFQNFVENLSRIDQGFNFKRKLNSDNEEKLQFLQKFGYVIFDHLVGTKKFLQLKKRLETQIKYLDFEFPCLCQDKINLKNDEDLIKKNFLATNKELESRGLTFNRCQIKSYKQMLNNYNPSTLKINIPDDYNFFNLWLDENIIQVIEGYMGFRPVMVEAFLRRNFPSKYAIMNHNWHRDQNHKKNLLKGFIFFTDCDLNTGAHHYIAGSIYDKRFRDKLYYSDAEIDEVWPIKSKNHITSIVPAGTIIIEDTRGLHKAGIPKKLYRDLGFSVFLPPNFMRNSTPMYKLSSKTYDQLSSNQKLYIPKRNII